MPEQVIQLSLIALLAACVPLTAIDMREHRLPNPITYLAILVALIGTLIATWLNNDWGRFGTALGVNLIVTLIGVALFLLNSLGLGDVKLLISLNQVLGYVWPWLVLLSLAIALTTATLYGLARFARRTLKWKDRIAFGPFLIAGYAVCAVPLIAEPTLY